jgi:hypothetical protein
LFDWLDIGFFLTHQRKIYVREARMKAVVYRRGVAGLAAFLFVATMAVVYGADPAADAIGKLLSKPAKYAAVPEPLFNTLGWDLPDGGKNVKALADASANGAFSPRDLEKLSPQDLGYRAQWIVERYKY